MEKMEIYDRTRAVPAEAQKKITGGRLNGMTDINPMWRIKTLTELFGPCGIGWKVEIVRMWREEGQDGAVTANIQSNLYVKVDGEWSAPIPGIGGSALVAQERNGLYTDDECYKKAYTDAISVACKMLGIGADVYWDKDATKYTPCAPAPQGAPQEPRQGGKTKFALISEMIKNTAYTMDKVNEWIAKSYKQQIRINDLTEEQFAKLVNALTKAKEAEKSA